MASFLRLRRPSLPIVAFCAVPLSAGAFVCLNPTPKAQVQVRCVPFRPRFNISKPTAQASLQVRSALDVACGSSSHPNDTILLARSLSDASALPRALISCPSAGSWSDAKRDVTECASASSRQYHLQLQQLVSTVTPSSSQLGETLDISVPDRIAAALSPWSLSQLAARGRHALGLGSDERFLADEWQQQLLSVFSNSAHFSGGADALASRVAAGCGQLMGHLAQGLFAVLAQDPLVGGADTPPSSAMLQLDMLRHCEHLGPCSPSAQSSFSAAEAAQQAALYLQQTLPAEAWDASGRLRCSSENTATVLAALVAAVHRDAQAEQAAAAAGTSDAAATVAVQLDEHGEATAMAVQEHTAEHALNLQRHAGAAQLEPAELARRLLWGAVYLLPVVTAAPTLVLAEPRSVHAPLPRRQTIGGHGGEVGAGVGGDSAVQVQPVRSACVLRSHDLSKDDIRNLLSARLPRDEAAAAVEAAVAALLQSVGGRVYDVELVLQRAGGLSAERGAEREQPSAPLPEDGAMHDEQPVHKRSFATSVPLACDQLVLQAEQELHSFLQGLVEVDVFASSPAENSPDEGAFETCLLGLPTPQAAVLEHGTGATASDAGLELALVAWDALSTIAGLRHDVISGVGQATAGPQHPLALIMRSRKVAPDGSEAHVSRRVHSLLRCRVLEWTRDPASRSQNKPEQESEQENNEQGAGYMDGADAADTESTSPSSGGVEGGVDAAHTPAAVASDRDMMWFADPAVGDRAALVGARPLLLAAYRRLQHSAPELVRALHQGGLRRYMTHDIAQATGDIAEAETQLNQALRAIDMLQAQAAAGAVEPQDATVGELELQLLVTRRRIVLQEARVRKETAQRLLRAVQDD